MATVLELPAETTTTHYTEPWLDHDEIERRAYFRYLDRGGVDGYAFEDWIAAETELKQEATRESGSQL